MEIMTSYRVVWGSVTNKFQVDREMNESQLRITERVEKVKVKRL